MSKKQFKCMLKNTFWLVGEPTSDKRFPFIYRTLNGNLSTNIFTAAHFDTRCLARLARLPKERVIRVCVSTDLSVD